MNKTTSWILIVVVIALYAFLGLHVIGLWQDQRALESYATNLDSGGFGRGDAAVAGYAAEAHQSSINKQLPFLVIGSLALTTILILLVRNVQRKQKGT